MSEERAARKGARMLVAALILIVAFAVSAGAWIAWKADKNPDVRSRRPRWVDETVGFDAAFWSPLLLTVVVGALLVAAVFWRAYRRLGAGEDLYAGRFGRGLRRRGEAGFDTPDEPR